MMKKTLGIIVSLFISFNAFAQLNIDQESFKNVLAEFDESLASQSLIILGEAHEVAGTYETELFIIEQMVEGNHSNIILEAGIAETAILNQYLESGNEEVLNFTRAFQENYKKLITGIRALNKSGKLEFIGVDFERGVCMAFLFDQWFADSKNKELSPLIKKLKGIDRKTSPKKIKNIILEVKEAYPQYEEEVKKELGAQAEILKGIIFNPVFYADFGVSSKTRDEGITNNLLTIPISTLQKSILIFGSNHFTNRKHFWMNYADKVNEELESILFLFSYKNCTNFIKKKNYNSAKPLWNFIESTEATDSKIDFTLAKDESFSPLDSSNRFILVKLLNQ